MQTLYLFDISLLSAAVGSYFNIMMERLGGRILRRTPEGRVDLGATVQNLVREPRSANELAPQSYLDTLAEQDRAHVQDFLTYARVLHQSLNRVGLAVTAVGSSVRPEAQRHNPVGDIDLRVLNSTPANSDLRQEVVGVIRDSVRSHLQTTGAEFEEDNATVETRWVKESRGGLVPFVDWYNDDPSFVVKHQDGLPIQISISGLNNYDLDTYLRREREHNGHLAVLFDSRQQP